MHTNFKALIGEVGSPLGLFLGLSMFSFVKFTEFVE